MVENKSTLFGIIAIIIGASGLGLGAYSIVNIQVVEGPQGPPGQDGQDGADGEDALEGFAIGILEPDEEEIISGTVTIRAIVVSKYDYSVSVLINGFLNATYIPFVWDTSKVADDWWNITVQIRDIYNNITSDEVSVYVSNVNSWKEIRASLYTRFLAKGELSPPFLTKNFTYDCEANFELSFSGNVNIDVAEMDFLDLIISIDAQGVLYRIFINNQFQFITKDCTFYNVPPRTPYHTVQVFWVNEPGGPGGGWTINCHMGTIEIFRI